MERLAGVLAVGDASGSLLVVAYLPGLGDDAFRGVPLAEQVGDQTVPEVVGAHVVGQLYPVRVHSPRVTLSLFPECGYSTFGSDVG